MGEVSVYFFNIIKPPLKAGDLCYNYSAGVSVVSGVSGASAGVSIVSGVSVWFSPSLNAIIVFNNYKKFSVL